MSQRIRIGVDTGGTFTDFVVVRDGRIDVFKKPSTPGRPEEAILQGIAEVRSRLAGEGIAEIIHGSTVATNALLERKGARTALIATAGFEDVLEIGRQTRRELYNIFVDRPAPLAPRDLRFGAHERILADGAVLEPLDLGQLRESIEQLKKARVESVGVCLLFSFANDSHERAVREALAPLNIPVSLSSVVLPEYREYERTSTTVVNAYLAPVMSRYLTELETRLRPTPIRVMQSNGGAAPAKVVAAAPVRTIVSGPAGGVVGAFHVARTSGYSRVITFDMGGTSTDVSLCDGGIQFTRESEVDGLPVGVPMIDIHTVGAGGGSIAEIDPGGALKVGPESAGADPGPICYGRGTQLTVTDANVLLGRLLPRFFLGGSMPLSAERIVPAIRQLEWARSWKSIDDLARGVIEVVNVAMERAIRLISVERGHDPRDFSLLSFGGAGGLHAAELARALGIPRVIVPRFPGALSALGLLLADARKDLSRSLLVSAESGEARVRRAIAELRRTGVEELRREGFDSQNISAAAFADVRYVGQSYELTIPLSFPLPRAFTRRFHEAHERRYGHANPGRPIEIVNVRVALTGRAPKPRLARSARTRTRARPVEQRGRITVYDRAQLSHGHVIDGPAIVGEYSSTTWVPAGCDCRVDPWLN
ncbi:MAG TPA: hydantoinase/oxoprolinase family protein, partial [Terriglobia bacterium]|nr:hydantoinase/oxoprolinase family protein [Terriglobia bacterium]